MYVAYLGIINGIPMWKFGKTDDIYRRCTEHMKVMLNFTIIYIEETDNKDEVEDLFRKELNAKSLLQKYKFEKKLTTDIELFTNVSQDKEEYSIEYLLKILDELIKNNPLECVKESNNKIRMLEDDKELKMKDKEIELKREETKQLEITEKTKQMQIGIEMELNLKKYELELNFNFKKLELESEQAIKKIEPEQTIKKVKLPAKRIKINVFNTHEKMIKFIHEHYTITGYETDKIYRDDFVNKYNNYHKTNLSFLNVRSDINGIDGVDYATKGRINNKRGAFTGLKLR